MDAAHDIRRQPLLVTSSPAQADAWAEVLDGAAIDLLVEITDAQTGDPGRSALVGVLGTRPPEFVHLITVPPEQRDAAVSALLEAGWDGREGLRGGRGALGPAGPSGPSLRLIGLSVLGIVLAVAMFRLMAG